VWATSAPLVSSSIGPRTQSVEREGEGERERERERERESARVVRASSSLLHHCPCALPHFIQWHHNHCTQGEGPGSLPQREGGRERDREREREGERDREREGGREGGRERGE